MKITILNGNPDAANKNFETYLNQLELKLREEDHQVVHLILRKLTIKYCIGCWSCWVKTLGQCAVCSKSR